MDIASLDHLLTDEERISFETQGYFVLENVLSSHQLEKLNEAADRADRNSTRFILRLQLPMAAPP